MKLYKKLLALGLCAAMTLGVVACGGSAEPAATETTETAEAATETEAVGGSTLVHEGSEPSESVLGMTITMTVLIQTSMMTPA